MRNFLEPDDEYDADDMKNVPQYAIERFSSQVEQILDIFEIPDVYVSDKTVIGDFNFTLSEFESYNHKFKSRWGIQISNNQLVWIIAQEIYESQF